ncbi:hypothetical protein HYDPIDRAFT_113627, partial [Hydnomerulius pinastri MD-312]
MLRMTPTSSLTPNLRYLNWRGTSPGYVPLLPLFLSPKLEDLIIPAEYSNGSWLATIPPLCPSVKSLTIQGDSLIPAKLAFLHQWANLKELCSPKTALTEEAFATCVFRCRLEKLWIKVTRSFLAGLQEVLKPFDLGGAVFKDLSTFAIRSAEGVDLVSDLLVALPKVNCTCFATYCNLESRTGDLVSFFETASNNLDVSELRTFTAKRDGLWGAELCPHLDMDAIRPLLQFRRLYSLDINTACFDMDDRGLEELATAFPGLNILQIVTCTSSSKSRITLPGLIPLLKRCPALKKLTISVDTATLADSDERPGGGVCNTRMTELWLPYSPLHNAALVAAFLSAIMPRVTTIHVDGKNFSLWRDVPWLMRAFAMTRKQEEKWYSEH